MAMMGLAVIGIVMIIVIVFIVLVYHAVTTLICILLSRSLRRVPFEHRKISPGLIFLLFIPLFNYIWLFWLTRQISRSFKSYLDANNSPYQGNCGIKTGLAWSIANIFWILIYVNIFANLTQFQSGYLSTLIIIMTAVGFIASTVLMIIYIVTIGNCKYYVTQNLNLIK